MDDSENLGSFDKTAAIMAEFDKVIAGLKAYNRSMATTGKGLLNRLYDGRSTPFGGIQ